MTILGSGVGEEAEATEVKKERAESERVSNDTGRKDLDEHVEFRLSWPAQMMRIPAKLSSRRTQISSIHSRLAPASNAAAEDGISYTVVTQALEQGSRGANNPLPTTPNSTMALAPPTESAESCPPPPHSDECEARPGHLALLFWGPLWIGEQKEPVPVVDESDLGPRRAAPPPSKPPTSRRRLP